MDITLLLAKMFGLYFAVAGLAIFIRKDDWKTLFEEFIHNKHTSFVLGTFVFVLGMVLVSMHNVWNMGFNATLITLFSWIVLLKGLMYFLLPSDIFRKWIKLFLGTKFTAWAIAVFIIGLYLVMVGYGII